MTTATMTTKSGRKCPSCDRVFDSNEYDELVKLYECGNCGVVFTRENSYRGDNHQCPECMKFSTVLTPDSGCPDCGDTEVDEETKFYECDDCGEISDDSDSITSHMEEAHPDDEAESEEDDD